MNGQPTTPVPAMPGQVPAQGPPPLVITLVHGTVLLARWRFWTRKPRGAKKPAPALVPKDGDRSVPPTMVEWFEEGSQFRDRLLKALGMPCVVTKFEWSGSNREWDRLQAAGADQDFRDKSSVQATRSPQRPTLREHIARYAGAPHVLIAHSHGGNVCLAALNDERTRQAVCALVCLSTPFISVRKLPDSSSLRTDSQAAIRLILLVAIIASPALLRKWTQEPWFVPIWLGFVLATVVVYLIRPAITTERQRALRKWAFAKRHGFAAPPVLVVMSDGDEALLALKIAEGANAALRALRRLAEAIPRRIFTVQRRLGNDARVSLAILAVVVSLVLATLLAIDPTSPLRTDNWSLRLVLKFLGAAPIATLELFVAWVVAVALPALVTVTVVYFGLTFVRWLAFGWGGYLGIDMTAETCPIGTAQVTRLAPSVLETGLHHGHSYSHPRAPAHIARFIRKTMGLQGESKSLATVITPWSGQSAGNVGSASAKAGDS